MRWVCKYHVVVTPKYRQKVFFGKMRHQVGAILRDLCRQRKIELLEGEAVVDHIHMVLSIPPKYSVANTLGFLKGKSAVRIHRELMKKRRVTGLHFRAAGYCVSTISLNEATIRKYVREQQSRDRRLDQPELDFE